MKDTASVKFGAAYIRVSTNMQEELSPDAQKRLILDYAQNSNIIIPVEHIFIENGISGRKADKRPEFQRMIATAKKDSHPVDVILVWKFSRFARNQEESIVYKSLLKKQCSVDVLSVSEPIVDGPFGSLIERIIEWMDEYYSTRLSGEVFRGMAEKALRGGYQSKPPFGYKIRQKGCPPEIVPDEADIVRLIFDKYASEGMSLFQLARYLNSLGLKTAYGNPFEKRSLEYIIQNPAYIGKVRWNRTENSTNRIKNRDEWIIKDGTHQAIVSEELFSQAQDRFISEYHPRHSKPAAVCKHWLSGLLKCSRCGRTLSSSTVNKRQYFQCSGYLKGKCPESHSIPALKAADTVIAIIKKDLAASLEFERITPNSSSHNDRLRLLELQLERIAAKESRIKESYRNGIDTLDEYQEHKNLIQKERDSVLGQWKHLKCSSSPHFTEACEKAIKVRLQSVYDIIADESFTTLEKNEALKNTVSKIVYNKKLDSLKLYYFMSPSVIKSGIPPI